MVDAPEFGTLLGAPYTLLGASESDGSPSIWFAHTIGVGGHSGTGATCTFSGISSVGIARLGFGPAHACPADFNHAGGVTAQDIFDFLSVWFQGC